MRLISEEIQLLAATQIKNRVLQLNKLSQIDQTLVFKITTILIQIIYFEKLKLKAKKLISYTLKIMLEFDLSKL